MIAKSKNEKARKTKAFMMPLMEPIRPLICFLILGIIFSVLRGLRTRKVRRDFKLIVFYPRKSPKNSNKPATTMKKSS